MLKTSKDSKPLQWHPAFYASLQIEFAEEADELIFESEHTLGTKPMLIDVIIIKKKFEEASKMCEALYALFKDDIEAAKKNGWDEGRLEGKLEATISSCKGLGASREKTLEMLIQNLDYTAEQAEDCLKLHW